MLTINDIGRRGFTLLELVICLALIGITGVFSAHFLWPVLDTYHNFSAKTDARYLSETLFHVLESEVRYGKDFRSAEDGTLHYGVVEADGTVSEYICQTEYSSGNTAFIPDEYTIEMSYQIDPVRDQVTFRMSVRKTDSPAEEIYHMSAVVRSLY